MDIQLPVLASLVACSLLCSLIWGRAFRWLALGVLSEAVAFSSGGSFACAMVGVASHEIESFRRIFEEALRRANIPLTKASIWLYGLPANGKPDHGRLRHELDGQGGGVSAVRMLRLPPAFHHEFLELLADAHGIPIVTARTLARVTRLGAIVPRPQPASLEEASCSDLATVSR